MEAYTRLKSVIDTAHKMSEPALQAMLDIFRPAAFVKKEYFVEEGQYPTDVAFIVEGVMRAFYRTSNGNEYNKTFFVENAFAVSLAAVIRKEQTYLNFQALTDCNTLLASFSKFQELFLPYPEIETFYRKVLENEWVVKKEQREIRLVLNSAEERYHYFQKEYPGLENRIPQYHIASHLGVTPIQLSRIRAKRL